MKTIQELEGQKKALENKLHYSTAIYYDLIKIIALDEMILQREKNLILPVTND